MGSTVSKYTPQDVFPQPESLYIAGTLAVLTVEALIPPGLVFIYAATVGGHLTATGVGAQRGVALPLCAALFVILSTVAVIVFLLRGIPDRHVAEFQFLLPSFLCGHA
jgi:hypothetical protein